MYYLSEKRNKLVYLGLLVLGLGLFLFGSDPSRQTDSALAADTPSPDAIAIRVIPNPDHHGISRWYSEQGFKGSPQGLTVDGYEALRDGRTVYVNAANVEGGNLYTNIYLISYNQEAEAATKSILDQIISHWKFNTNIPGDGRCSQTTTTVCLTDADCPGDEYCTSQKAKITRDTKRLSRLAEIKIALENYKEDKGYYPKLAAGTYLANKTISTWPSWQQTLAKELGVGLPTDPINKLGACKNPEDKNYNSATCWNEKDKLFAGTISGDNLILPVGSNAFVYTATANGLSYNVCAVMESGLITGLKQGACAGSATSYSGATTNNKPVITCGTLVGTPGKEFKGYVGASDSDGDTLNWNINLSGITTWPTAPAWKDTVNLNQKEIYSSRAGNNGDYNFSVTVDDRRTGGQVTKTCTIKIMSVPVTPTCSTSGACDGFCPAYCTGEQDPDCKVTGCRPGDGKCDITDLANECGTTDCGVTECCIKNSTCDSVAGETHDNCPSDCPLVVNSCVFSLTFPCVFK